MMARKTTLASLLALVALLRTGTCLIVHKLVFQARVGRPSSKVFAELPTTRKETISQMTAATQAALRARCSRMDVELPPGAHLGVEKAEGKASPLGGLFGLDNGVNEAAGVAKAMVALQRSDRELARLFVEMFQPLGPESVCAVFSNGAEAQAAKESWKGDSATRVYAFSEKGGASALTAAADAKSKKAKKQKKQASLGRGGRGGGAGFAAKLSAATTTTKQQPGAADANANADADIDGSEVSAPAHPRDGLVPEKCEVLLVVAPKGADDLTRVETLCRSAGLGTVVVLLNARLESARFASEAQKEWFLGADGTGEFEPVFQLKPPPPTAVAEARRLNAAAATPILWRAYPNDWQLCSKPSIGNTKKIAEFKDRPSAEAVVSTLTDPALLAKEGATFEGQLSALLGKISSVIG